MEKTIKTLVVMLGKKQFALALMPGDRWLDIKQTPDRLPVGGISPFVTMSPLPAVMESSLLPHVIGNVSAEIALTRHV